jgi:VWFA-related protein
MTKLRIPAVLAALVLALQTVSFERLAAQQSQTPPAGAPEAQQPQQAPPPADAPQTAPPGEPGAAGQQQPIFRGGINFVRVDVIVTGRGDQPVLDLKETDFEITEDGRPQTIEQFRLIRVDGNPRPGEAPPKPIRTLEDEELEAAREDTRIFVFFLDDYHVRQRNSLSVRAPLIRFIETQLRPADMVAVMYPLTPVSSISFTRNHKSIISAINNFEGRKFDYRPLNQFEANYMRYSTEVVERIRNDVVMGALQGLAIRLGSLREGRKSVVFVSEGFTAMLPPQMRRRDASAPTNPLEAEIAALSQDSPREITAEWFGQSDVISRMREVFTIANRNNTAFYSLDPRGLTAFDSSFDDVPGAPIPSSATDGRALQLTQDTLRVLSEETDGRAIVNRNTLEDGLAQMVQDSSYYYLLGYTTTQAANDGKFHEIKVRVKRGGVDVRARKGYWALTPADAIRAAATPSPDLPNPVRDALASIATSVQAAKYVRTWLGTERGPEGKTRVTLVWEPLPAPAERREQPGRVSLLAADAGGNLVFRGRAPDAALASTGAPVQPNDTGPSGTRTPAAPAATAPQRIVFDAPPGTMELRLTVEAAGGGGTLDSEIKTIEVPDLTAPQAALSTPRVFRGRTARDLQAVLGDGGAVPVATREFSRAERLLIRFDVYGPGSEQPTPTAALLNRAGQKMSDLPVAAARAGGTHQVEFGLSSIPAGEYLVEITAKGASGEAKELVPMRVGS